jgi:uncharacterized cofD-like protein
MKIVIFGGGTGLSNILTGFKKDVGRLVRRLTAVVTVSDSGGSSGILKKIYDIPAIGDLRNCLLALSNIENYVKKTMQYRFAKGNGLKGHPLGNLFLVALLETEGDILKAIQRASKILNISGEIIPSTFDKVELVAIFEDKKKVIGEENIVKYGLISKKRILDLRLKPANPKPPDLLFDRINKADILIFGPGSLYTSVLPNFLVPEIKEAVDESKALKILIINLLTQPGETDNFSAKNHFDEFLRISRLKRIDALIVDNSKFNHKMIKKIKNEGKEIVIYDPEDFKDTDAKIYCDSLISKDQVFIKHDPFKTKKLILQIAKDYGII